MLKKLIFIAILGLVASCGKEVKPIALREDNTPVIDTLQTADVEVALKLQDSKKDDSQKDGGQDLVVNVANGDFENLGEVYYGSVRYASLLKAYNGYTEENVELTPQDSIKIPTFEKLVYVNKQNMSRREKRNADSIVSIYESYLDIEDKLKSISESTTEHAQLPDDIKKELNGLANDAASIYVNLQEGEDRPHGTIGELKALSSYFTRMTQDSLQSNDKSIEIVHYRLAGAFIKWG